jgi:hypothetical protein
LQQTTKTTERGCGFTYGGQLEPLFVSISPLVRAAIPTLAALRTFVLATVAVPIVIYGLMPHLHRLRARLLSAGRAS